MILPKKLKALFQTPLRKFLVLLFLTALASILFTIGLNKYIGHWKIARIPEQVSTSTRPKLSPTPFPASIFNNLLQKELKLSDLKNKVVYSKASQIFCDKQSYGDYCFPSTYTAVLSNLDGSQKLELFTHGANTQLKVIKTRGIISMINNDTDVVSIKNFHTLTHELETVLELPSHWKQRIGGWQLGGIAVSDDENFLAVGLTRYMEGSSEDRILLINLNTNEQKQVFTSREDTFGWYPFKFSANNNGVYISKLVYTEFHPNPIYFLDLKTGEIKELPLYTDSNFSNSKNFAIQYATSSANWSCGVNYGNTGFIFVDLASSSGRNLLNNPSKRVEFVRWSPDDTRFIFSQTVTTPPACASSKPSPEEKYFIFNLKDNSIVEVLNKDQVIKNWYPNEITTEVKSESKKNFQLLANGVKIDQMTFDISVNGAVFEYIGQF